MVLYLFFKKIIKKCEKITLYTTFLRFLCLFFCIYSVFFEFTKKQKVTKVC